MTDRKSVFTLVELIVVITIIAILAGMLLPVLNQAREKARGIACLSSMKQLVLARQKYADDNESFMPGTVGGTNPFGGGTGTYWHEFLSYNKYIPTSILCCPQVTPTKYMGHNKRAFAYGGIDTKAADGDVGGSFVFKGQHTYISQKKVKEMSSYLLVGDTVTFNTTYTTSFGGRPVQFSQLRLTGSTVPDGLPHMRHSNRCNFGFMDGHATSISGIEMLEKCKIMFRNDNRNRTIFYWFESTATKTSDYKQGTI